MKILRLIDIIIPFIASIVIKLVALTLRLDVIGKENLDRFRKEKSPVIFVFWHNRLLYSCYYLRKERLTMMISKSRDGDLIARVARYFGIQSIRGSSSRDGLRAISGLAEFIKRGEGNGGITPDGPRGPSYVLQPGALILAKKSGAPILPVSMNFNRKKIFQSWDRFLFPYPFARAVLVIGEPFRVREDARGEKLDTLRIGLEARLKDVTENSDRYFN